MLLLWFLQPVEELAAGVTKLEDKHSTRFALGHPFELSITGKDDEVLSNSANGQTLHHTHTQLATILHSNACQQPTRPQSFIHS